MNFHLISCIQMKPNVNNTVFFLEEVKHYCNGKANENSYKFLDLLETVTNSFTNIYKELHSNSLIIWKS
jgi:hypothetical protein